MFLFYSISLIGQDYKIQNYGENGKILVGVSPRKAYQDSNFSSWFNSEYTNYQVDTKELLPSIDLFSGKIVKIVLGTWCPDSRREVPRFVKILDFINFPEDKIQFLNVDRNKKGLRDEVDDLKIDFVPTFIVYESGKEIGRIVETPIESLEKDLVKIIISSNQ